MEEIESLIAAEVTSFTWSIHVLLNGHCSSGQAKLTRGQVTRRCNRTTGFIVDLDGLRIQAGSISAKRKYH